MPIQDPLAESNALPLSGFRVLELGNYIAGPTAARLLADFGAEVIKVERPITGDETRSWRLYGGTTSMLFRTLNRNKKSIVLDLKTEEGRAHVLDLVASCDVVVENFRPGTLEKWGYRSSRTRRGQSECGCGTNFGVRSDRASLQTSGVRCSCRGVQRFSRVGR